MNTSLFALVLTFAARLGACSAADHEVAWKRLCGTRTENCGCPVALMHIAVEYHGSSDVAVALHAADGNRNIIDHAKAFAVIRKGVVKSASNVNAAVVPQRLPGSNNRPSCHVPECIHKFFAVGYFQFQFLARAQRSTLQFLHPEFGVDEKNVFVLAGWRRDEILLREGSSLQQALPHSAVLTCVKDVLTNRQRRFFRINQPQRKHIHGIVSCLACFGKHLFHGRIVIQTDRRHALGIVSGFTSICILI